MGEKCNPYGRENETCSMVMNCPEEMKMLAEKYDPEDIPSFRRYLNETLVKCGNEGEEYLVCCHSPTKLEVVEDVSEHPNRDLLRRDICGPVPVNLRIANGWEAKLFEFPWMALLTYVEARPCSRSCGGSVISDRYVLTAAHCVYKNPPHYVWLGKHNFRANKNCKEVSVNGYPAHICPPKPQEIPVERVIIHPNYIHEPQPYHDIALLRLTHDVNFTTGAVRPVCLPFGLVPQKPKLVGLSAQISGWGHTEKGCSTGELRKATIPINEYSKCDYVLPHSAVTQICAEYYENKHGTCEGDSGGPMTLVASVEGDYKTIQYGIVSGGSEKCHLGIPSLYTHVGHYMKWIMDNMNH